MDCHPQLNELTHPYYFATSKVIRLQDCMVLWLFVESDQYEMGKFLNPKDLKANLYRIFKEAEEEIIIISPHKQLLDEFKNHSKRF